MAFAEFIVDKNYVRTFNVVNITKNIFECAILLNLFISIQVCFFRQLFYCVNNEKTGEKKKETENEER